ncbi:MAG: hypothetical protein JW910_21530, partial [Anaerolineae bacterium]|nr:hypothetical protein [Anaerolineae bacterium]
MATVENAIDRPLMAQRQSINWELGVLVVVLTVLIIAPFMRLQTGSGPLYLTDMLLGLLLAATLLVLAAPMLHMSTPGGLRFAFKPVDGLALAFLALIIPSAVVNLSVFGVLPVAFVYLRILLAIAAYFIIRQYVTSPQHVDRLLTATGLAGIMSAVIGLLQIYVVPLWNALEPLIYFGTPATARTFAWNEGLQVGLRRAYGGYEV